MSQVPVLDHPAEAELFGHALTCEAWLPADFRLGDRRLPPQAGEAVLRAVAVAEDSRNDDPDERTDLPQAFLRLEAKVDLMLNLLGRLARASADALPLRAVRWSHRGVRIDTDIAFGVRLSDHGVVLIEPASWLSDHIELPARVIAQQSSSPHLHHLWLRFDALPAVLGDALERHLFRMHRRQIAEARQARQS